MGDDVKILSLCGSDTAGGAVKEYLKSQNINDEFILSDAKATAQSVCILPAFLRYKGDAEYYLNLAIVFASYKIGDKSACRGFLSEQELINLSKEIGE